MKHKTKYTDEPMGIKFKAHTSFNKADIDERQTLVQNICEVIWGGGR